MPRSRRSQEEPGCTNFNRLLQCVKDVAENHKIVMLGCSSLKTVEICGQIFNLPSLEDLGLDRQRWLTPRIVEGFQVPWLGLDERSHTIYFPFFGLPPTIISSSQESKAFLVCQTFCNFCFFCWALRSFMIQNPLHPQDVVNFWDQTYKTLPVTRLFREWSTFDVVFTFPWIAGNCHFANDQKNIRFTIGCILSFCKSHFSSVFIWTIQLNRCGPLFFVDAQLRFGRRICVMYRHQWHLWAPWYIDIQLYPPWVTAPKHEKSWLLSLTSWNKTKQRELIGSTLVFHGCADIVVGMECGQYRVHPMNMSIFWVQRA